MPLYITNEYGTITLSDKIVEDAVARCCQEPALYDLAWLAPKSNIISRYNSEGEIELGFSIYVKFGHSIKDTATKLGDSLALIVKNRFGKYPAVININVSGVKSQNLVRRNMDIQVKYNSENPGRGVATIKNEE